MTSLFFNIVRAIPTRIAVPQCWRLAATALLLAGAAGHAAAQADFSQALRNGQLFPPDLVLRQADQIALTEKQSDQVMNLVREMKATVGTAQAQLRDASEKLAPVLQSPSVNERQALEQFAAMLKIEQEAKQGQLAILIRIKNLLSPEQQEKLREIVRQQPAKGGDRNRKPDVNKTSAPGVREELDARMQKVRAGLERWRREGRDPAPLLELMKEFGELMQAGKLPEAKETLNRALQRLNEEESR